MSGLPSSIPSENRMRRAVLGLGLVQSGVSEPTWNPCFPNESTVTCDNWFPHQDHRPVTSDSRAIP